MKRKVFINRKQPAKSGGSKSFLKWLMLGVLALLLLVIVTPLVTKKKDGPGDFKRTESEKGVLVKGIPKPPASSSETASAPQQDAAGGARDLLARSEPPITREQLGPPTGDNQPGGDAAKVTAGPGESPAANTAQDSEPHAANKPRLAPAGPAGAPAQALVPAVTEPAQKMGSDAATQAKEVPKVPAAPSKLPAQVPTGRTDPGASLTPGSSPRPGAVPPVASAVAREKNPAAADAARKPPAAADARTGSPEPPPPLAAPDKKPAAASGQQYIVQVGCFKDSKNAEELQQKLQRLGYPVVAKSQVHPSLGKLHVLQLLPVSDGVEAAKLMEKLKKEAKVEPILIKLPTE
jgi:hypothetical protein